VSPGVIDKLVTLAVALACAAVLDGQLFASELAHGAHLSPQRVSQIALAEFAKSGYGVAKFHARAPSFMPERTRWFVFFIQVPETVKVNGKFESIRAIDGDMLVVVDDRTGKACVQQAIAIGPCT
jgi:hypothetical protein